MLININIYIIIMLIGKMKNSRKVPISGSEIKVSRSSTHSAKHRQHHSIIVFKSLSSLQKQYRPRQPQTIVKAVSLP